jgi:ATP-dependent RNA helicase SUPV3L1/SUV3
MEEIWRPRRHPRGEHRRAAPGRQPRRSEQKESGPRQQTPPAAAVAAPAPAAAPANGNGERAASVRDARSEPPKGGRPERSRDAHARRPGKGPERSGKGPDRRRREEQHRKPEVHSAAPPRRASIDADSPFAALGALRDALVKRGKETSS